MGIVQNVEDVRSRIGLACQRAGRSVDEVRLVAVTKYVDIDRIGQAFAAGITEIGENRAQEYAEKLTFFEQYAVTGHFIGQLQSNKVKYICTKAATVQSVDRLSLAEAMNAYCLSHRAVQDVLIQVNIGDEPQKGGVTVGQTEAFLDTLAGMPGLRVTGMMCVPPAVFGEDVRPYFRRMRLLYEKVQAQYRAFPVSILSMGMSHDFETAIEEGATMVRVGSAIFGERQRT